MSDIKVFGTFRNETESSKIAYASQVYDEAKGKMQSQINQEGGGVSKFRFAHWNIGHFTYYDNIQGSDTPNIPAELSAEMVLRYKRALNEIDADVLGVCEDDPVFDAAGNPTLSYLYGKYGTKYQGTKYAYMCASLYSNLPLSGIVVNEVIYPQTVQTNRYYKRMSATLNGHTVIFIETHLDFNQGSNGAAYRAAQIRKLIADCTAYDHVVIAADYNVATTDEYEMANHGYIGDVITHVNHINLHELAIDNVITKGFKMSNIKVWQDTFNLSDHAAISCDLEMIL